MGHEMGEEWGMGNEMGEGGGMGHEMAEEGEWVMRWERRGNGS